MFREMPIENEATSENPENHSPEGNFDTQEQIKQLRMGKAKTFLEQEGILKNENGVLILNDKAKLSEKELHDKAKQTYIVKKDERRLMLRFGDIIDFLLENKIKTGEHDQLQPAILLPKDETSAFSGDWDNGGVMDIGEMRESTPWNKKIKLADGSIFSYAELAIAKKLRELKARRDENGKLQIFDKTQNKYVAFSARSFVDLSGINPCVTDRTVTTESKSLPGQRVEGRLQFNVSGALFTEKYLPNLLRGGGFESLRFSDIGLW